MPPEPPPFLPFTFGASASPADAFSSPHPPFTAPRPLITREEFARHLQSGAAWRSLPDGTPLRLQAEGMEYILDDFGGFTAGELRSAHRLLFFATRTEAQMRALWIPPAPRGESEPQEGLALHVRALQAEIGAWASATFAPDAFREVRLLALQLWEAIMDRLPVSGEKKNPPLAAPAPPDSASPTSAISAGSSLEEMPSATSSSSSAPTSAPSSGPSSVGLPTTDTPSSPCPSEPAVSPPPAP